MENLYGWHWQDFAELGSTNDCAVKLSELPPSPRFAVTAQSQAAGRGRRGRSWQSLEGNLFMSLGLEMEQRRWGELVFVVSLALLETVRSFKPGIDISLKWPNDVLVAGGKISGILLEKGAGMYIIIGIGVNIASAPAVSGSLLYHSASLAEAGIKTDRITFLKAFLQQFNCGLERWNRHGFAEVKDLWLQSAKGVGSEIRVNLPRESLNGIFKGIGDDGCLLLETAGEIKKIAAGDVFFQQG